VTLRDRGGEALVFVGTVKDMTLHPRALSAAFIHVYQFANANAETERNVWISFSGSVRLVVVCSGFPGSRAHVGRRPRFRGARAGPEGRRA